MVVVVSVGKFNIGDFLAKKCQKMAIFAKNPVFRRFLANKERFLTVSFSPLGLKVGKKACMLLFDPKGG